MTPGKASAQGKTLIIDIPGVGKRPAAHVFDFDGGIGFIDSGWTEPLVSSHTQHIIEGTPGYVEGYGWLIESKEYGDIIIDEAEGAALEGDRKQALALLKDTFPSQFR